MSRDSRFTRKQHRRGKGRHGPDEEADEEEFEASLENSEQLDNSEQSYRGSVYRVPDGWWGFDAVGRKEHPGACTAVNVEAGQAVLLKGTDARNVRGNSSRHVILQPTDSNGLLKPTAFALEPRTFRLHRVTLLHHERQMGRLDVSELDLLDQKLREAFPGDTQGRRG